MRTGTGTGRIYKTDRTTIKRAIEFIWIQGWKYIRRGITISLNISISFSDIVRS